MGGCVPHPVGHLRAMGAAEVGATMTDRIEELRAQQKERMTKASYTDLFVRGAYLSDAEAALTEALKIAECDICHGTPHPSGLVCVCEGTNEARVASLNLRKELAEQERLLEQLVEAGKPLRDHYHKCGRLDYDDAWDAVVSDLNARSVPERASGLGSVSEAEPLRTFTPQGPTGDLHEQGRKHRQPWCLTHDAPMVCSAGDAPTGDTERLQRAYDEACAELAKKDERIIVNNDAYLDEQEKLVEERDEARIALVRILELAERSDAHPELPIADIAREALSK